MVMKKNVALKISSSQYVESLEPSGQAFARKLELEDSVEIQTEGTVYSKNGSTYITYEESEKLGMNEARAMLKLTRSEKNASSLQIRRYTKEDVDNLDMNLQQGVRNITRYKIPQLGSLDLEVYTLHLDDSLDEEGYGKINVDYRLKFDQFYSRRTKLEIEVRPS